MVLDEFPDVNLVKNESNVGFARAVNLGIALSRGQFILLLNSDAAVKPSAIDTLIESLTSDERRGLVGPKLLYPDGSFQTSCYCAPTPWRELVHLYHLESWLPGLACHSTARSLEPCDVDVLTGACLAVRRDAVSEVGGFDEGYFMYSEEVELCERMRDTGWGVRWEPRSEVVHHVGGSTAAVPTKSFIDLHASKLRFYRRNRGRRSAMLYKAVLVAAALPRLAAVFFAPFVGPSVRSVTVARAARYGRLMARLPSL